MKKYLTNLRKDIRDENIGCGVFVDLLKAFDTVDRQTLLAKLSHYGILGASNDWFKSYLSNRNQYVSINRYKSDLAAINCRVPQGSALRLLLFLLYINDFNHAIKFCKVHHFAERILNSEFCLSFEFPSGSLHFPLLRTLKIFYTMRYIFFSISFHKYE